MKRSYRFSIIGILLLICTGKLFAQGKISLAENFDDAKAQYQQTGRGTYRIANSILKTQDVYLSFGQRNWADYEAEFNAKVPADAEQVQICAGFHAANRDDRYILMLRGGVQQNLYLARLGYMGTDDFLALRDLEFKPLPGTWYHFKIQVAAGRIRVFMGNEALPRIDIRDKFADKAPAGKVTLGGSWIVNEFSQLKVRSLSAGDLPVTSHEYAIEKPDKEKIRERDRKSYRPLLIQEVKPGRNTYSLNGKWLFSPGYQTADMEKATSVSYNDDDWHVMNVPDFWNPIRVWLHGERYNTASKGVSDNYFSKETARCENYTFDYRKTNLGWYRHWIKLPEGIQGKQIQLAFDAVSKVAEVYINGVKAGSHIGMFGDFKVDCTGLFKPGTNLLAVKVTRDYVKDIKDPDKIVDVAVTVPVTQKMMKDIAHGFFNEDPAGIWQPVSLEITDPVHIADVFIKPTLQGAVFEVTIRNHLQQKAELTLATSIVGLDKKEHLYHNDRPQLISLNAGEQKTISYTVQGLKPKLWSPEHPNLYDFEFALSDKGGHSDFKTIRSGFKTFNVSGDHLYLNGKPYWLRGANHSASPLAPNDTLLADRFSKLMKAGNVAVTRTHTVPATETWMDAYDRNGVGVSYEGTWPWLFLSTSMPDLKLLDLWRNEFYDLLRKYRNHPSLLFWTVNNEMKFYDNDPDTARANQKMHIISDVVKEMRVIDPTRPVVFDSNYKRNIKKFGQVSFKHIDDGDIDDVHAYLNWYDHSIFDYFKGEWQQKNKNPGRPLISQEMSTGYTDETGHATRFYNYVHQNPAALSGMFTREFNDPKYFMIPQAFITKELAEALRRSNERSAGILHFALITWFYNVYDAEKIKPFPVYDDMRKALQPVLVSAELWGRHFYAGAKLPVRFCVVNDQEDGSVLKASELQWKIVDEEGKILSLGSLTVPHVGHYERHWLTPEIVIPNLPQAKTQAKLVLTLTSGGKVLSQNDYSLLLADKSWVGTAFLRQKHLRVYDGNQSITSTFDHLGITFERSGTLLDVFKKKADVYVLSGLDSATVSDSEINLIRTAIRNGARVLLSGSGTIAHRLYPELIRDMLKVNGEITTMEIPESPVFNDIDPLDTRYFNNDKRESPAAISGAFRVNRNDQVLPLASYTQVHGYLTGEMSGREQRLDRMKGFPLVQITDKGKLLLSEISFEKANTDPVAAKWLVNILNDLCLIP